MNNTQKLTFENITNAVTAVEEFLAPVKIDSKEKLRLRLGVEEALLDFRTNFGEEKEFELRLGNVLGRRKIQIRVQGDSFDPFVANKNDDESSAMMRSMLVMLGKRPVWYYSHKVNILTFAVPKKEKPEWVKLVISISSAIILALIVRLLPFEVKDFIQNDIFSPLLTTFIGFLNAVAGPMIFLAVVWGIYSLGDTDQFSKLGKLLSRKFALYIVVVSLIVFFLAFPFFNLTFGESTGGDGFSSIYQMILDIIPTNLFRPFSTGNTLQILFVAVIIGVAMIIIGEKTQYIATLAEQLNLIVSGIMGVVAKLVPYFIFGSLFIIVLSSDFEVFGIALKFFLGTLFACVFTIVLQTIYASIRTKNSIAMIWKKSLGTFLVAITTASSSACFAINLSTCTEKYNMDKMLASFGVPFMQVLYKPSVSILYMMSALCMAENTGISVSVGWLATAVVMSIILSVAAPPIPGGSTASFTILFTQLGIPMDTLAVVLTITALLDFILTATNMFGGQTLLLDASKSYEKNNPKGM